MLNGVGHGLDTRRSDAKHGQAGGGFAIGIIIDMKADGPGYLVGGIAQYLA
ncbi:hypothetical protein D3C75_1256250 [compost metagenome]